MRSQPALARIAIGWARLACLVMIVAAATVAAQPAAADADALSWAPGVVVTPPANAGANPDEMISSLSCPSAGNCTAVGSYQDTSGKTQGLLATESGGYWSAASEAPLPTNAYAVNPNVSLTSVSCATAANCTAVGSYLDVNGLTQGLRLTETGGSWTQKKEVIHPQGVSVSTNPHIHLTFVSCATATNCLVGGTYTDSSGYPQGLLETEINGLWSTTGAMASLPSGAAAEPHVAITSGSCGAAGTCVAVGTYLNSSNEQEGLLLTGTDGGGTWTFTASAAGLPGGAAASPSVSLNSVSCPAAGACVAVGSYEDASQHPQGLLLAESGGTWQTGTTAVLPVDASADPSVSLNSVSCSSAGNCDAVGDYVTGIASLQGLMLTETGGSWQPGAEPTHLPADSDSTEFVTLSSVSCFATSGCAATGNYADDSFYSHPLLLSESSNGTWSTGIEPALPYADAAPNAYVQALSCAPGGGCAAASEYSDQAGDQLASAINGTASAPAGTTLLLGSLPALSESGIALPAADFSASLSGGAGESGTVAFSVFGPQDSPPSSCAYGGTTIGTATVSGNGSYSSAAGFTPASAGDYWWYANYGGDLGDTSALSACGALMAETEVQTPTLAWTAPLTAPFNASISQSAIAVSLSDAMSGAGGTVTFTVFGPQSTPPTTCTSGGISLGTATVQGNGSLSPDSSFTPSGVGDYWWYASYGGDLSDPAAASSCGTAMAETIVRANPTLSLTTAPSTATVGVPVPTPVSASLLAGVNETGTVRFTVFGPQASPPLACGSAGTAVGTATVHNDGTYAPAASFTPSAPGSYWWYASYSGDGTNNSATSVCGGQMHETVVSSPSTTTTEPPAPLIATTRIVKVTPNGNVLRVTLTCRAVSSQSCVNTVTVTVTQTVSAKATRSNAAKRTRRRLLTIGTGTFKVRGGISRQVSIRLNRTGTSLLASRRKLTALLKLHQGRTVLRRAVTLRAPRSPNTAHTGKRPRWLAGSTPSSGARSRRRPPESKRPS